MTMMMRRSALRAVSLVGLACIAGKAAMATPEQDAEIIRVCDELLANKAEFDALYSRRVSIQDEERTNPSYSSRPMAGEGSDIITLWTILLPLLAGPH